MVLLFLKMVLWMYLFIIWRFREWVFVFLKKIRRLSLRLVIVLRVFRLLEFVCFELFL